MGVRATIRRAGISEYLFGDTGTTGTLDRSTLVSGTYNPVYYSGPPSLGGNYATNRVGILTAPSNLTAAEPAATQITYSTNSQVIKDTAFYRKVSVTGQNITFQNCIFYGTDGDKAPALSCGSTQVNTTFVDCTFTARTPQYPQYAAQVGIGGGTFLRCDFYGTDDGLCNSSNSGWPQTWTIKQCAFHDFLYFSPFNSASQGINDNASHTDGIQWSGGKAYVDGCGIWGFFWMHPKLSQGAQLNAGFGSGSQTDNTNPQPYHFWGNKYVDTNNDPGDTQTPACAVGKPSIYTTSCTMFSPALVNISSFTMTNCYINGSTWPLNISPNYWTTFGGWGSAANFVFTNNKIGTNHRWGQYGSNQAIIANTNLWPLMTISGNTDLATGAALTSTDLLKAG